MAFLSGLAREGLPTWPHSQFAITRPCSQERQRDVSSGSCQTLLGLLSSKLASPGSPEPSPHSHPPQLRPGQRDPDPPNWPPISGWGRPTMVTSAFLLGESASLSSLLSPFPPSPLPSSSSSSSFSLSLSLARRGN